MCISYRIGWQKPVPPYFGVILVRGAGAGISHLRMSEIYLFAPARTKSALADRRPPFPQTSGYEVIPDKEPWGGRP